MLIPSLRLCNMVLFQTVVQLFICVHIYLHKAYVTNTLELYSLMDVSSMPSASMNLKATCRLSTICRRVFGFLWYLYRWRNINLCLLEIITVTYFIPISLLVRLSSSAMRARPSFMSSSRSVMGCFPRCFRWLFAHAMKLFFCTVTHSGSLPLLIFLGAGLVEG